MAVQKPTGSFARPAMVYNGRNVLEEPFVGAIAQVEDVVVWRAVEVRPSFRDDDSDTRYPHCFDKQRAHLLRIFNDCTAESNINWWRSGIEEFVEFGRCFVIRRIAEEKSTDICFYQLIF